MQKDRETSLRIQGEHYLNYVEITETKAALVVKFFDLPCLFSEMARIKYLLFYTRNANLLSQNLTWNHSVCLHVHLFFFCTMASFLRKLKQFDFSFVWSSYIKTYKNSIVQATFNADPNTSLLICSVLKHSNTLNLPILHLVYASLPKRINIV
jgi:hypothetical protein